MHSELTCQSEDGCVVLYSLDVTQDLVGAECLLDRGSALELFLPMPHSFPNPHILSIVQQHNTAAVTYSLFPLVLPVPSTMHSHAIVNYS